MDAMTEIFAEGAGLVFMGMAIGYTAVRVWNMVKFCQALNHIEEKAEKYVTFWGPTTPMLSVEFTYEAGYMDALCLMGGLRGIAGHTKKGAKRPPEMKKETWVRRPVEERDDWS